MTRYRVQHDGLACPDKDKPWAVVDRKAGDRPVKWCASEDEAELTAALYERQGPVPMDWRQPAAVPASRP